MYKPKPVLPRAFQRLITLLITLLGLTIAAGCIPPNKSESAQTPIQPPTLASTTTSAPKRTATQASVVTPSPTVSRTIIPCTPASLESGTVGIGLLDKPMDYHVILPPCYAEQAEKHYPVLYLLHGQNATQDQWLRLGVAEAAERLMLAGDIPPFLIILPFDHSYKQPREYRFEEVFLEQLIPTIDQRYRTLAKRDSRAIGGLSRGGAWSIYIASRHPEYFSVVGGHSPAVFYSNTSALPVRLRDIPPEQRPIFYIDAGDKDIEFREIQKFTNLLNDLGIPHEWHYNLGAHDEKYWSSHVEEYLRWYAGQLPPSP